jgi:putative restriction endonuclease
MGFGIFIHRSDSIYEDSPAEQYQFPGQYLRRVEACIRDWIIYYEPRKIAETRGYFAIAKVREVIPDPGAPGMYLALIEPGSYLDFANPVPFNGTTGPIEQGVLNDQGRISGRAQSAVRPLSPRDFKRIFDLGFVEGRLCCPDSTTTCRRLVLPRGRRLLNMTSCATVLASPYRGFSVIESSVVSCCARMMSVARSPA